MLKSINEALHSFQGDLSAPLKLLTQLGPKVLKDERIWLSLLSCPVTNQNQQTIVSRIRDPIQEFNSLLSSHTDPMLRFCYEAGVVVNPKLSLHRYKGGMCWLATEDIAPGSHLLGVPAALAFDSSTAGDPIEDFFPVIEHLSSHLLLRKTMPGWDSYIAQLESNSKIHNLPYLNESEVCTPDSKQLIRACQQVIAYPSTDVLCRACIEDRAWAMSVVLSRRSDSFLFPVADFIDHSPIPNSHPTLPNVYDMSVADALDNYLAGVDLENVDKPHYHLYAVRPIKSKEYITISYHDADPRNLDGGSDVWKCMWGFVPKEKASLSHKELAQLTSTIVRLRLTNLKTVLAKE